MAIITVKQSGGDFSTSDEASDYASDNDTISVEGIWTVDDTRAIIFTNDNITWTADSDSENLGYAHSGSGTWYRHRSASGHSVTVSGNNLIVEKLDIQNKSTGISDEVFRVSDSTLSAFTVKRCVLGFASRNDQQDIVYYVETSAATFLFENCKFYSAYRAVVDFYDVDAACTVNFNSCTSFDVGYSKTNGNRSGVFSRVAGSATHTVNIFNCLFHVNSASWVVLGNTGYTTTLTIDRSRTNVSQWSDYVSETKTDSSESQTFTESTASAAIIMEDVTTHPYDFRLTDHANNDAKDDHSDSTGASLTIPATDIVGTSKNSGGSPVQGSGFDSGAFEIIVASGADIKKYIIQAYMRVSI